MTAHGPVNAARLCGRDEPRGVVEVLVDAWPVAPCPRRCDALVLVNGPRSRRCDALVPVNGSVPSCSVLVLSIVV